MEEVWNQQSGRCQALTRDRILHASNTRGTLVKSKKQIEEMVEQIIALPEKEQVEAMVRILDAMPEEGRKLVIAYCRLTKAESFPPAKRFA